MAIGRHEKKNEGKEKELVIVNDPFKSPASSSSFPAGSAGEAASEKDTTSTLTLVEQEHLSKKKTGRVANNFDEAILLAKKWIENEVVKQIRSKKSTSEGSAETTDGDKKTENSDGWKPWWGTKKDWPMSNAGCVIGYKYVMFIEEKETLLAGYRVDWEPEKKEDGTSIENPKGKHCNLILELFKETKTYCLRVKTENQDFTEFPLKIPRMVIDSVKSTYKTESFKLKEGEAYQLGHAKIKKLIAEMTAKEYLALQAKQEKPPANTIMSFGQMDGKSKKQYSDFFGDELFNYFTEQALKSNSHSSLEDSKTDSTLKSTSSSENDSAKKLTH